MSKSAINNEPPTGTALAERGPGLSETEQSIDPDELLSLLSDDHALEILKLLHDRNLPAREIADELAASRTTVYRRLNRLEEAGLVDTSMAFHSEGHHRQQFRASLDEVVLSFEDGGITVANAA
jgi:DNA-binding transcriptional ArsR family regulator